MKIASGWVGVTESQLFKVNLVEKYCISGIK
jgi:hypothetical protein